MAIEPVTHLEKSIAGTVDPVTHLEKVIAEYGGGGGGGGEVTVDQELLPSSPNPVRNSVIYAALEDKASKDDIADFITDADVSAEIAEAIGGITSFEYYLCGEGEYDPNTGIPTVQGADTNHIYLTPTSGTNLNMYAYINNTFTFLGTTEVDLDGYAKTENLKAVAFSGEYADLLHPPLIPAAVTVDQSITQGSSNPVESSALYREFEKKANSDDLKAVATSGSYNDLSAVPINSSGETTKAIQLGKPLTVTGGDSATAGKISLNQAGNGQITDGSTSTIFGFMAANELTVGSPSYALKLRGSGTNPKYNGKDLALKSDVPTVPSNLVTGKNKSGTNTAFTIRLSSSAPASGTADNIITIVIPS